MDESLINLSYLSVVNMDSNQKITSSGSGFYINLNDNIYFITAKHVVESNNIAYLEIKYQTKGCKLKPLLGLNYAIKTSIELGSKVEDIDIAFINITENFDEYQAYYQEMKADVFPPTITKEAAKIILKASNKELKIDDIYTFAGLTRPQIATPPVPHYIYQRTLTIENVVFKSCNSVNNDILIFTPINGHRGDNVYRGCSGSPLLDSEGNVRAVVLSGSEKSNVIYAYDINKMKNLVEADIIATSYFKDT